MGSVGEGAAEGVETRDYEMWVVVIGVWLGYGKDCIGRAVLYLEVVEATVEIGCRWADFGAFVKASFEFQ